MTNKLEGLTVLERIQIAIPNSNDPLELEQNAFEAFGQAAHFNMAMHPLHWLFLDVEANAARKGWKAALEWSHSQLDPVVQEFIDADKAASGDASAEDFKFPNVTEDMIAIFLRESMKADEIAGEDAVRRARMIELLSWFQRYPGGGANPKWFVSHAYEILYYVATYARAPHPNLTVVANWLRTISEDQHRTDAERGAAARLLDTLELSEPPTKPVAVSRERLTETLRTCRHLCANKPDTELEALTMTVECLLADAGVPVERFAHRK